MQNLGIITNDSPDRVELGKYFNYNIDVKPHLSVTWYSCNCQEKYCQSSLVDDKN